MLFLKGRRGELSSAGWLNRGEFLPLRFPEQAVVRALDGERH